MDSWPDFEQTWEGEERQSAEALQSQIKCKAFYVLTGGYDGNICLLFVNEVEERIVTRQLVRF